MKTVVLATNNAHKAAEITGALNFEGWEFKTLKDMGVESNPAEDADSFEGNARIKAVAAQEAVFAKTGRLVAALADDSGLVVDALGGAPGVYSSRYAGAEGDDEANNAMLLYEMRHVPPDARTARFVCTLVYVDEMGDECIAEGTIEGKIAFEGVGEEGFGYDPLFLPDAYGSTLSLAQVSQEDKNAISHRGNALRSLHKALSVPARQFNLDGIDYGQTNEAREEAAPQTVTAPAPTTSKPASDEAAEPTIPIGNRVGCSIRQASDEAAAPTIASVSAASSDSLQDRGYFTFGADGPVFTFTRPPEKEDPADYHRFAFFANPTLGVGGFSRRVKEALENLGHTVYWFTPELQPWLICEGVVQAPYLTNFIEGGHIDAVVMCDGVTLSDPECLRACKSDARFAKHDVRLIVLAGARDDIREAYDSYDMAISAASLVSMELALACPALPILGIPASRDETFAGTALANTVAYGPGILCLQDATEQRIAYIENRLKEEGRGEGYPVRCFGMGWPAEWSASVAYSEFAYAAKSEPELLLFVDDEDTSDAALSVPSLSAVLSCGATPQLCVIKDNREARVLEMLEELTSAADSIEGLPTLEEALAATLINLREEMAMRTMPLGGVASPREVISVLGYFGCANFGDEYILHTIDERFRLARPGLVTVAVSENPFHTFICRGIYAITLADESALDATLRSASAALVVAGLLFDQGTRWGAGYPEIFSTLSHSTLPGIVAYVTLAHLNDAAPVMYGIGAGPLDLPESKRMVKLMGEMGAAFLARDEESVATLLACGVDPDLVFTQADTAFLGAPVTSHVLDPWFAQNDLEDKRIMAVSLRTYENLPEDFAVRVAAALDSALDRAEDLQAVFCLLDPEDAEISQRVIDGMEHPERTYILDPRNDLNVICELLDKASMGFSMRYHCSLLLNAAGKPCVGIGYLPKVVSLYASTGCSQLLLTPDASEDAMEATLALLLQNYSGWAAMIRAHLEPMKARARQSEEILLSVIDAIAPAKAFAREGSLFLTNKTVGRFAIHSSRHQLLAQREMMEKAVAERDMARQMSEDLLQSHSFKIGHSLMRFPGMIKARLKTEDSGSDEEEIMSREQTEAAARAPEPSESEKDR